MSVLAVIIKSTMIKKRWAYRIRNDDIRGHGCSDSRDEQDESSEAEMVQTCEREMLSEEVREIKNGGFKER